MMRKPIIISIVFISVLFSTCVQAGAEEKNDTSRWFDKNFREYQRKNQKEAQNKSQEVYIHSDPAKLLCKIFSSKTPLSTLKDMMPDTRTQIYKGEGCRKRYSGCYMTVSETKSQKIIVKYRRSWMVRGGIRLNNVNLESKESAKPYFYTPTKVKRWLTSLGCNRTIELKGYIWGIIHQRFTLYDEIKDTEKLVTWPIIDVKMARDHQGVYRNISISLLPYEYDKDYHIIPEVFCRESLIPLYNKLQNR